MVSNRFSTWTGAAGRCAGGAKPGARALMAAILRRFPEARSWGIYSCRPTALGNPSTHGEGRALDIGCSVPVGARIVRHLLRVGPHRLGIQCIIHDRKMYTRRSPRGRPYGGHPHRDHVHVELTRRSARYLSYRRARRILSE